MSKIDTSINPQSQPYDGFDDVTNYIKPHIIHRQKIAEQIVTYEDLKEDKEESEYYNRRKISPQLQNLYQEIHYPTLKAASDVNHFDISKIDEIQNKIKTNLEETDLEKAFNEALVEQKHTQNELVVDLFNQIRITMKANEDLHMDLDAVKKRIEKEAKTSEKLEWISKGSNIALATYAIVAISLTLATAGALGPVFGLIGALAGAAHGTLNVTNTIRQMQSQERQGEATVIQQTRQTENDKIHNYLSENNIKVEHLHQYILMQVNILNNHMRTYQSLIRG